MIGSKGGSRHLRDERLFDCYVAQRGGEHVDPPVAEHLADCFECGRRYAELAALMDNVRAEAGTEADGIFTTERLAAQRRQIAKRLEHVGRPARIISFPARIAAHRGRISTGRGVRRWIYAAAAAGLVVGVGLGTVFQSAWRTPDRPQRLSMYRAAARPFVPVVTSGSGRPDTAADDAFLSDLDVALEGPTVRALQPFDALTPHVRDVRDSLR